jgi:hypothetical protein
MSIKIKIVPGVNVIVDNLEFIFLKYVQRLGKLYIDILNSDTICVINILVSKGILIKKKRGNRVYIQLRDGISIPKNQ